MAAALHLNAKPFSLCSPSISLPKISPSSFRVKCSAGTSPSRRYNIALLPGDGIGPEVIAVAKDVLNFAASLEGLYLLPLSFFPHRFCFIYMLVVGFMFCWMDTELFGVIVHFVFIFDEIGFCFY